MQELTNTAYLNNCTLPCKLDSGNTIYFANTKADSEGHKESCNRGSHMKTSHIHILFVQYIIISNKIYQDVHYGVRTTAGYISEGVDVYPFSKWLMKEINKL